MLCCVRGRTIGCMRSVGRIALLIAVGALGLFTAGGLAGESRAATSLDGTWNGNAFGAPHALRVSGTLEGGFKVSAAETWMVFGCPVSAGTVINTYTPKGGGSYDVTYLLVTASTTQGVEGVKCEYAYQGPETVTITSGGSGSFRISGCSASACGSYTREGPAPPPPAPPTVDKLVVALLEMPDRYGVDADGNGLIDVLSTPEQVNPKTWPARLLVGRRPGRTCDKDATYSFKVDGKRAKLDRDPGNACAFTYTGFNKLGRHDVEVVARKDGYRTGHGMSHPILRDLLIVGLGDSNGSGEGNPDNLASASWIDQRCDRSHWSYQAKTAAALEDASPLTSVTFVHLACSGASITQGLIGSYDGINPVEGADPILPQVTQLRRLIAARKSAKVPARKINALILSVGVNDLRFGAIIEKCIGKPECWDATGLPGTKRGETVDHALTRWLGALPAKYNRLANAMTPLQIPSDRIYITRYFDSLRNENAAICDPLISTFRPDWVFDWDEATWAYRYFLVPLNKAVTAAAGDHKRKWNVVGPPSAFRTHGYCAADPWIVRLTDSAMHQRDANGTMHATIRGHEAQRDGVLAALKRDRIDGTP